MIDAHCHLQFPDFGDKIDLVLRETLDNGVERLAVNGTQEEDWERVANLADRFPERIHPFFGLHPWYASKRSDSWLENLRSWLEKYPMAGVGEIGLDRWMKEPDLDDQSAVFRAQWELACRLDRPLAVHCLKAWGSLLDLIETLPRARFLLHSYSGSREMIARFIPLGGYFSISGWFLKEDKSARLAVFDGVQSDRLLIESDAPEMSPPAALNRFPQWHCNHPGNTAVVYQRISAVKDVALSELERQIEENFSRWIGTGPLDLEDG